MKFLSRIIAQILINALALWLVINLVPAISFQGSWLDLLIIGAIIGLLNFLVKPVLKLFLGPLIVLTLGLFTLVINAFLLWLATQIFPVLIIPLGWSLIWATLIFSLINLIFHLARKK